MLNRIREYARATAPSLGAQSPQERQRLASHALALLLVAALAIVKYVSGLTVPGARFALYGAAVAASAAHGGFAPGLVAALASIVVGALGVAPAAAGHPRAVFLLEGMAIALVVSDLRSRLVAREARVDAAEGRVAELSRTLVANDVQRKREWDDYRETARLAQAALQQAADDARQRLAALETLTDPSLHPLGEPETIGELLERLRGTVGADGAALVHTTRAGSRIVAARGLQPAARAARIGARTVALTPGRVAIVHNDAERVEQLSAVCWPAEVASLMAVPVVCNGQVRSTIEVVNERPHRASDWDVALARVAADRLAAATTQQSGIAATG